MLGSTLRLTAACVVIVAALSHLTPAPAEPQGAGANGTASGPTGSGPTGSGPTSGANGGGANGGGANGAAPGEPAKTAAAAQPKEQHPSVDAICRTLATAAADNDLPEEFFTRLIWQESHFDPTAVSPAGAQGIAQFMPATAAMRGLINAFEPLEALRESASYLRELRTTYRGNLGLAAAAYNAGPAAVDAWLAGRRALPAETQAYVMIVTGYPPQAWNVQPLPQLEVSKGATGERCVELAKLMIARAGARARRDLTASPAWGPWGVQLAGSFYEGGVLAAYERLRRKYPGVLGDRLPLVIDGRRRGAANFIVRVSEKTRADANALCARLQKAGGACIVLRNPRS
ncbi:MAG: lytic transglycosylase domain-containing protein [Alphaproteobacteria bacterium]|nr:lytic transglycosylase domain-containing protein [Alphaproteobacteria bacterium]